MGFGYTDSEWLDPPEELPYIKNYISIEIKHEAFESYGEGAGEFVRANEMFEDYVDAATGVTILDSDDLLEITYDLLEAPCRDLKDGHTYVISCEIVIDYSIPEWADSRSEASIDSKSIDNVEINEIFEDDVLDEI